MKLLVQIRENKVRFLKTFCVYLAFSGVGLCSGIVGPTLLDLQLAGNTTLDKIAMVLPARSGGYAIGSFTIGLLYNFVNPQFLIFICAAISACFIGAAPFCRDLYGIIGTLFAQGWSNGMLDSSANMFILFLWGKSSTTFMQALHFSWGVGAFVSPLIARPFLLPLNRDDNSDALNMEDNNATSSSNQSYTTEMTVTSEPVYIYTADDLLIQIPYLTVAVYCLCTSSIFLFLFLKFRVTEAHASRLTQDATGESSRNGSKIKFVVVGLTALFLHLHCGLVIAYGTLLTTYAVNCDLQLSKATGASMSAAFWMGFTFFRLITITYIEFVGAEKNLLFNLGLTVVACVFLIPFGGYLMCFWIGVVIMGLGCSSIWASVYGYLENFFPLTSRIAATFTVAACLGEFVLPTIMGNYIDKEPRIFLWITGICTAATCGLFLFIMFLCNRNFNPQPIIGKLENPRKNSIVSQFSTAISCGKNQL